jgi:glycosyltransferase involved in cell wall biosynthesis
VRRLRVALIGSARFPIAEPFAGGLEAHIWLLATGLRRRGHEVTLFAGPGSDETLGASLLEVRRPRISRAARADVSMGPDEWLEEHHAYLDLMMRLSRTGGDHDVIHNHSLHHLPIAMAAALPIPVLSTLHTPPTAWLESAIQVGGSSAGDFAAVSGSTARAWSHLLPGLPVVPNGIDVSRWTPGAGGGPLVWSGRIAPEKGTHLAIEAARLASEPLLVAGPVVDRRYFEDEVRPLLGYPGIEYVGHLEHRELAPLVGAAAATLVTPCWDEPYGLVVAESMAAGTPVCGFRQGALPELVGRRGGVLVQPGDFAALARAIRHVRSLDRATVRRHAVEHCSLELMVERYEDVYLQMCAVAA